MKDKRWIVLLGFVVVLVGAITAAERSSATMAAAATHFLASLTPEQRQQASFAFNADERLHWHFIPTEMFPRNGLMIKAMTEPQRVCQALAYSAWLAYHGLEIDLDTVLAAWEASEP